MSLSQSSYALMLEIISTLLCVILVPVSTRQKARSEKSKNRDNV